MDKTTKAVDKTETDETVEVVKVIFRKFKDGGDIIAIFPEIPATLNAAECESYQTVGQHGACAPDGLIREATVPATPDEYQALKEELESIGYKLDIRQRYIRDMVEAHLRALRSM